MIVDNGGSRLARMIGMRIIKARTDAKLSQQRLGQLIGKSQATLGHYETGRVLPPLDVLCRIATATTTTPAFLLGDLVDSGGDWFEMELLRRTKELTSAQKFELIALLNVHFS